MKPTYAEQCLERAEKAFVSKWGRTNDGEFLADSLQDVVELATRLNMAIEGLRAADACMRYTDACMRYTDGRFRKLADELEAIPGDEK